MIDDIDTNMRDASLGSPGTVSNTEMGIGAATSTSSGNTNTNVSVTTSTSTIQTNRNPNTEVDATILQQSAIQEILKDRTSDEETKQLQLQKQQLMGGSATMSTMCNHGPSSGSGSDLPVYFHSSNQIFFFFR